MNIITKRIFTGIFSVWFAIASTLGTFAHAQPTGSDFEAPLIDHEEIKSGVLGDTEVFAASVVDNNVLESVDFFYRFAGESLFTKVAMQPLASSSYYSVKVDTSERVNEKTAIEYYIRAEDGSGNVVLKGLSFDPLVRALSARIAPPVIAAEQSDSTRPSLVAEASPTEVSPKGKINWLYVGLGVLIAGGIAAASGGSNAGVPPNDDGDCEPNCSVITLNITPPQ